MAESVCVFITPLLPLKHNQRTPRSGRWQMLRKQLLLLSGNRAENGKMVTHWRKSNSCPFRSAPYTNGLLL